MERLPKTLLLIVGLICLVCTSCVDSNNPLSDPKQSKLDSALLGVWRVQEKEGEVTYYHVGRAGEKFPAGMMRIVGVKHDKNGEVPRLDASDMLAFITTLGKNHYLNVTILDAEHSKKVDDSKWDPSMADGYFFYKYEINGERLTVAGLDSDQKKDAINAGKIKGVEEDNNVRITDTTENLARFIAAADQEKFFPAKDSSGETNPVLERVK